MTREHLALERKQRFSTPLAVAASSYLPLLFTLLTAPLTARALGPTGRGLLALVVVIDEAGSALFRWGLPEAVAYHLKQGADVQAIRRQVRRFAWFTAPASVALGLAVIAIPAIRNEGAVFCAVAFIVTAWSPFVNTTTACLRNLLMAAGDLRTLRNSSMVGALPFLVAVPLAFALDMLTVEFALCIYGASALMLRIYFGVRARTMLQRIAQHHEDVTLPGLLRYGSKAVPAALSDLGNSRLDQLILAPLLGLSQLGIYSVAVSVGMLPVAFGLGLAHAGYRNMPSSLDGALPSIAGRAVRLAAPPLVAITLVLGAVVPFVLPIIYGQQFKDSVIPCLLLLPGALAMSINYTVWQTANALGRPGISSMTQVLSLVATVVLLAVLLKPLGVPGAALATSLAYSLRLALSVYFLRRVGVRGLMPGRRDVGESLRMLRGRS